MACKHIQSRRSARPCRYVGGTRPPAPPIHINRVERGHTLPFQRTTTQLVFEILREGEIGHGIGARTPWGVIKAASAMGPRRGVCTAWNRARNALRGIKNGMRAGPIARSDSAWHLRKRIENPTKTRSKRIANVSHALLCYRDGNAHRIAKLDLEASSPTCAMLRRSDQSSPILRRSPVECTLAEARPAWLSTNAARVAPACAGRWIARGPLKWLRSRTVLQSRRKPRVL
jgi:hypothetical protein